MMQIQQYGLQWTIDISDPKHVVLKQGQKRSQKQTLLVELVLNT